MNNCSILLTDDSETDRYISRRFLHSEWANLHVYEAVDGMDALKFLADYSDNKQKGKVSCPPPVILLDVNMPRMDGFEFLEKFSILQKNNDCYKSVSIVMLSSSGREDDIEKTSMFSCVKGYVVKGEADQCALTNSVRPFLGACANAK